MKFLAGQLQMLPMFRGNVLGKSVLVGIASVTVAMTIVSVLVILAVAISGLAVGSVLPGGGDPATFFFGGAWIDLLIIVLLSFASGFLFTYRRLHQSHYVTARKHLKPAA